MKITVQFVVEGVDADSTVVREVFALERGSRVPASIHLAVAAACRDIGSRARAGYH